MHNDINYSYDKNKQFFESVYDNKKDNKNLVYKNYQKRTNDINNMLNYLYTLSNHNSNNIKNNYTKNNNNYYITEY